MSVSPISPFCVRPRGPLRQNTQYVFFRELFRPTPPGPELKPRVILNAADFKQTAAGTGQAESNVGSISHLCARPRGPLRQNMFFFRESFPLTPPGPELKPQVFLNAAGFKQTAAGTGQAELSIGPISFLCAHPRPPPPPSPDYVLLS